MRIQTIHLRDTDGRPYCNPLMQSLLITTSRPDETTCHKCQGIHASGKHPLTTREMANIIGRTVTARSKIIEPVGVWRKRQAALVESQHRALLALEDLHAEVPWWCIRERRHLNRVIRDAYLTVHSS